MASRFPTIKGTIEVNHEFGFSCLLQNVRTVVGGGIRLDNCSPIAECSKRMGHRGKACEAISSQNNIATTTYLLPLPELLRVIGGLLL